MQKNKDFTLIIHGPLTIYTMFTLYRYVHEFNIIIVSPKPTIKNNIVREIDELVSSSNTNISLILYGDVLKESYNNSQNKYLHFFSVDMGLNLVNTDYTIKIRSDEFYSNITPFMENIKKFPNKIVTNDVFFRNSKLPLHPSDHLMGGKTENMKRVFSYAKRLCQVPEDTHTDSFFRFLKTSESYKTHKMVVAEQYLGISVISQLLNIEKVVAGDLVDNMKSAFHIVPNEKLGVYRIMYNSKNVGGNVPTEYFDNSYFDEKLDINDIELYK